MNHTEFQIAAAAALFATFLVGWLAGWLVHRAGGQATMAPPAPVTPPDTAAALDATRAELREAQLEIEELRAYIDRKLAPPQDG